MNGSDLVHSLFGANAVNIFKIFKFLFAVKDTMVDDHSRKRSLKHKVDYFFSHLIQVSTKAFEPGSNLSSNEQYARFQGHHEDTQSGNIQACKRWVFGRCAL